MDEQKFIELFEKLTEKKPVRWQLRLFHSYFVKNIIPKTLDLPTGLGKTMVMPIWLIARALNPQLPRRLVYIVDRRAVVDQATELAIKIRTKIDQDSALKEQLGLIQSLPISTLRGQYIDNRAWLEDPSQPSIIVGTVDMIGSRLLFEGYGVSHKMRPYHAALLGNDTLMILDEAHLVPPFERLLSSIADDIKEFGPQDLTKQKTLPLFKFLSLSATGQNTTIDSFSLTNDDEKDPIIKQRLDAKKSLKIIPHDDKATLASILAKSAWDLSQQGCLAARIVVFCDEREDAKDAKKEIEQLAKGKNKTDIKQMPIKTSLFVGGRRLLEREVAAKELKDLGFLAGDNSTPASPVFLFATSAAEVGVDLDANHMVCDLVSWERMIQRLGRVNRLGNGDATIIVIEKPPQKQDKKVKNALAKPEKDRTKKDEKIIADFRKEESRMRSYLLPFTLLPKLSNDSFDVSPSSLRQLKLSTNENLFTTPSDEDKKECQRRAKILLDATTPVPLRPELNRAILDAWSMTSLKSHTGRPEIKPWLRGWIDVDLPQTTLIWRKFLPLRPNQKLQQKEIEEIEMFFEAAPPHLSEQLEIETYQVQNWLKKRAELLDKKSQNDDDKVINSFSKISNDIIVGIILNTKVEFISLLTLNELFAPNDIKKKELEKTLSGATVILDSRFGGLENGLLNEECNDVVHTIDDGSTWLQAIVDDPLIYFRIQEIEASSTVTQQQDKSWLPRLKFIKNRQENGEPIQWLLIEKWQHDSTIADDSSEGCTQLLDIHQQWCKEQVEIIIIRLNMDPVYAKVLSFAALHHDEGKQALRWQRAFKAPTNGVYAKTLGPINLALLDNYRHEFGSILLTAQNSEFRQFSEEHQDLILHLMAAHHGFARPNIGVDGCDEHPPSALADTARAVALRFARLQKQWGPWGLAWWEALLRASDQLASRKNARSFLE